MIFPDMKGLPLHRVMMRTVTEFVDDEMSTYASALAYQMLFSLFPFILFLIALIGFLHLPDFFSWLRLQSELVLPPQALEQVNRSLISCSSPRAACSRSVSSSRCIPRLPACA